MLLPEEGIKAGEAKKEKKRILVCEEGLVTLQAWGMPLSWQQPCDPLGQPFFLDCGLASDSLHLSTCLSCQSYTT